VSLELTAIKDEHRNIESVKYMVREVWRVAFHTSVLLVSAGTVGWVNAWVVAGLAVVYQVISIFILRRFNPGLIGRRNRIIQPGTKRFDKFFVVLYPVFAVGTSMVCGLDAVRFRWSSPPLWLVGFGIALYIVSCALGMWAMAVNQSFETTVVIRAPEVHKVCDRGPYRVIRHPGYVSGITGTIAYVMVLGSYWGILASLSLVFLFIVRTHLEDKALQAELHGYREYTELVRYRLVPGVW